MVYRLVFENLVHRKVRTLLTTLAIGLGVTMMLSLVGLSRGMLEDQKQRARGIGADILVLPPGSSAIGLSSAPMTQKLLAFVGSQPHVKLATGSVVYPLGGLKRITGIDYDNFTKMSDGFRFVSGGPFSKPDDIIIDEYYAHQNDLGVGDTIPMLDRDWKVCGVVEPGKLARVIVPIDILQELTGTQERLSIVYAKLDDPSHLASTLDFLKEKLTGYQVYSLEEFTSQFSASSLPELRIFTGVVIGLAVLFGFLLVFLSMHTAILERTREIGILKAVGASPSYIFGILARETAVLAALGTIAGILFSFGTRALIQFFIPASMVQAIVPDWWPIAGAITLAAAWLGVVYPAWKAVRQDTLESLSYD